MNSIILGSGDQDTKKLLSVAWDKVSFPKLEGGLGLRNLEVLNKASGLAGILALRILLGDTFEGQDRHGHFSQTYKRASIWPGIKAVLPNPFSGAKWVVGNGRQIPFWTA